MAKGDTGGRRGGEEREGEWAWSEAVLSASIHDEWQGFAMSTAYAS